MAIAPPKCKTCGKVEWRHVCGPKVVRRIVASLPKREAKAFREFVASAINPLPPVDYPAPANTPDGVVSLEPGTVPGFPPPSAKVSRKEYLKLKARERRAAEKVGLTIQQYRAKQKESKA